MKSTMQKLILVSVLHVMVASGAQAGSLEEVYDTLSMVQQAIAVSHPKIAEDNYWAQNDQRFRFEDRIDERRRLIGYTDPCRGRSSRYNDDCQYENSYRDDQRHRHHRKKHRHDDHHGKHHHKHHHGRNRGSYRSCDD